MQKRNDIINGNVEYKQQSRTVVISGILCSILRNLVRVFFFLYYEK